MAFAVSLLGHPAGEPGYPFLIAFAALIVSAAWCGPGPGLMATLICTGWVARDLAYGGVPALSTLLRSTVFLAEGLLLCLCSRAMTGLVREAASREARYLRLVETASEGIWVLDENSAIRWANPRLEEMLGVEPGQLMGRQAEDFFFPADLAAEHVRASALNPGQKQQFDRRLRRSDGSELWVLASRTALTSPDGHIEGLLAMMTDITERKRAEHALRQSELRYRSLFEGVPDGVYQSTPDGRILSANPMLLKMLGCSSEAELRQLNIGTDLYVDPALRRQLLLQLERDGSLQNVEYQLRTRDGRTIWVLENARLVRGHDGNVLHYEGILTDVTERRSAEDQLREAQKIEAVGRLARGVARDFSTAIGAITADLSAAIGQLPDSHPARPEAVKAMASAASAQALVRQLLHFSDGATDSPAVGDIPPAPRPAVLLLETDALVRELSRDMLERQGYDVFPAAQPDEARRIATRNPVRLFITALRTPSFSGTDLANELRALRPGLRVLYIVGHGPEAEPGALPTSLEVIIKPFSAESLGRRVQRLLADAATP